MKHAELANVAATAKAKEEERKRTFAVSHGDFLRALSHWGKWAAAAGVHTLDGIRVFSLV